MDQDLICGRGNDISLLQRIQTGSGTHPSSVGSLATGIKQLGCKTDHSSLSSVEIKNTWQYTTTPSYAFIMWCLIKYKNRFIICLLYVSHVTLLHC